MDLSQKFNDFFTLYNGKFVEAEDSSNYAMCMDLAFKWLDFINIPRDTIRHLYAYQVWTNPFDSTRKYFDLIPNSATNVPQVGDVVVLGQSVGFAGHICIASGKSNSKDLVSLDQNWSSPKSTKLVTHTNYNGVMGWLHPKTQTPDFQSQVRAVVYGPMSDSEKVNRIKALLP